MEERAAVLPKRVGQGEADMEPVVVGGREVHVGGLQGLNKGLGHHLHVKRATQRPMLKGQQLKTLRSLT